VSDEHAARRDAVRDVAASQSLDGVLAFSWRRSSVAWLTGYSPGYLSNFAALWLPAEGEALLGVRFDFDEPRAAATGLKVVHAVTPLAVLPPAVSRIGVLAGDLGVVELPVAVAHELASRRIEVVDLVPVVAPMQAAKSPDEVRGLRRAARVAALALDTTAGDLTGRTDFEIAAMIEASARRQGATRCLALVGVGDGAVITEATGVEVGAADAVGLEVTLYVNGACMHVTVSRPPTPARDVDRRAESACREARTAIMAALVPGAAVDEVVRIGDDVLDRYGLREFKEYDFGHGIGAETPELPQLVAGNDQTVVRDMVVSVHVGVRRPYGETAVVGGPALVTSGGAIELLDERTPWSP